MSAGMIERRRRRAQVCAAVAVAASGCLAQTAVLKESRTPNPAVTFTVIDERPEEEKETKFLSLMVTDCDYSVRQLGDERTDPPRLALLRDDLVERLGARLHGKTLVVSRYVIYFNNARAMREGNARFHGNGALAGALIFAGANCSREEMTGGWFAGTEVTTPFSPLIVEIDASLDGKAHSIRAVYSTPEEFPGAFGEPGASQALFAAMRQATRALAASLSAAIRGQQGAQGTPSPETKPDAGAGLTGDAPADESKRQPRR